MAAGHGEVSARRGGTTGGHENGTIVPAVAELPSPQSIVAENRAKGSATPVSTNAATVVPLRVRACS